MTTTETETVVRVGDFFEESWGYDQTNADFYQVVRVSASGKTIWLRHVQTAMVRDNGPAEYVAPLPDTFSERHNFDGSQRNGEPFKRLVKFSKWDGENRPYINMTSYSNGYLWDGKPAFQTGAQWGH